MQFQKSYRYRFGDIDDAGTAYYPTFFHYFHSFFEDWWAEGLGVVYPKVLKGEKLGFPVVRVECDFFRPVRYGDEPQAGIRLTVPIEGDRYTLDLQPHSVRAPIYQLKVQLADGSYVEVEPGPVRTLRGRVAEIEDSAVAASWEADGLHARIFFSDGEQYWLQPVASKIPNAAANQYVLYRNEDIIAPEKVCGLDGEAN